MNGRQCDIAIVGGRLSGGLIAGALAMHRLLRGRPSVPLGRALHAPPKPGTPVARRKAA